MRPGAILAARAAAATGSAQRRATPAPTHPAYRADIDGLRALAVLPVLFYHAGVRGFSGGFVGVDIFFVISGFLITGILVRDLASGRHSILEFYRRRILRIFPALMAMLAVTTIGAAAALLPTEIGGYARSLGATAVFSSNILFYARTDYFNPGAASEPLLHGWSLAVEEQWYVVWPLLLAAIGAHRRGVLRIVTIGLTAASLAFSVRLLRADAAADFYLLPPRAWELGLGAVLAMVEARPAKGLASEALGWTGLLLILFAVKTYTAETAFPGLAAVPPCLGAALLIATGTASTRVARMLAWRPIVFVGAISYSLYLWHWPVIVFAEVGLFLPRTIWTTIAEVIAALGLAVLSWRYVERPFRANAARWPTRRVLAGGGAAIAVVLLVALALPPVARGVTRFTPREIALARFIRFDGDGAYRRGTCFMVGPRSRYDADRCLATSGTKPALLLVGDSHAAQLWPGLSRYRGRYDILQATATGCVAKIYPLPHRDPCETVIDGALTGWIAHHRPAALILAARWQWRWLDGLEATLRNPAVRAAHPVLIGPIPQYSTGLPRLIVFAARRGDPGLIRRAQLDEMFAVDRAMREMAARTGTRYVSLVDLLCRGRECRTLAAPDVPLQFDASHLTPQGSALVVDAIMPQLRAAMAGASRGGTGAGGAHRLRVRDAASTVDVP